MEKASAPNGRVLLAVLAHPDDESFGMGGTLALYAAQGVQVHLICATGGEVGMMDPEYMEGFDSVRARREHELRCAASHLGLAGVYFLGYRDSGMPGSPENQHPEALVNAPEEEAVAAVVYYIRKLCPQVVLTFDPIGGYRHPDHIRVHDLTRQAFFAAGNPQRFPGLGLSAPQTSGVEPGEAPARAARRFEPQLEPLRLSMNSPQPLPAFQPSKLYYHTMSRRFLRLAVRLMPLFGKDPTRWGRNGDIDLTELTMEDFPVHAVINYRPVERAKAMAAACHESQGGPMMLRGLMGLVLRMAGTKEIFMRAHPQPAPRKRERDLFEGIA